MGLVETGEPLITVGAEALVGSPSKSADAAIAVEEVDGALVTSERLAVCSIFSVDDTDVPPI